MATFYPEPHPVPVQLVTSEFILEPLTSAHLELDYQAVMDSRIMLRAWGGGSWPADDFTLEGNLDDLDMHDGEHQRREAFTYTVLTPDRRQCLGCVYITPLANLVQANPDLIAGPNDAVVRFWVIGSRLSDSRDVTLLRSLQSWFTDMWEFSSVRVAVRETHEQQAATLRRQGLEELAPLVSSHGTGQFPQFLLPGRSS